MISHHLNDELTYKMLEANCVAKVMKVIPKIIEKCKDNFNKKKEK